MKKTFSSFVGKGLRNFLSCEKLVDVSSRLNLPLIPPIIASIKITNRCNSKCSYCDIWKSWKYEDLSLIDIERLFGSLRKLGTKSITLGGGEPLIHSDLIQMVSLAKSYGLRIHVLTNGVKLTREKTIELVEGGVSTINLSLDTRDSGIYRKHRGVSFKFAEQALASLLHAIEEYPNFCAVCTCVVTAYNIDRLVPLVQWICEYGKGGILMNFQSYNPVPTLSYMLQHSTRQQLMESVAHCQDLPAVLRGDSNLAPNPLLKPVLIKQIDELIQLKNSGFPINNSAFYLKGIPDFLFDHKLPSNFECSTGYTSVFIGSDLKISPCWRLPPIGDLHQEDIRDVWFSKRYQEQRKKMKHLRCPTCWLPCHNEPEWYRYFSQTD